MHHCKVMFVYLFKINCWYVLVDENFQFMLKNFILIFELNNTIP